MLRACIRENRGRCTVFLNPQNPPILQLGENLEKKTYMAATVNRQVLLKSRPEGIPERRHFQIVESALPTPAANQVLVRNLYLSVVPATLGWVRAATDY